MEKGFVKTDEF